MILLNVVARRFPPLSPAGAALLPCSRRDEQEGELGSAHTATTSPYVSPSISVHVRLVTFNIDTNTLTDRHSILLWIKTVLLLGNWSIIPDSSCLNASKTSGSNLKPLLFEVNKFREQ
uniref:Uncharacterized protein n=1 Tax=Oryza barthii TaxID=65489 RepID=A0A0D3ER50_9ORYZ